MSIFDLANQAQSPSMGGAGGIGALDGNQAYPLSRMDKIQYAVPRQLPASAEVISADYDPKTDVFTGMPDRFAKGGIASFAEGGSPFTDDPNNFAADLTKAYTTLFGRDPSQQELRTNVDALNKDPDAYAFIVRQIAESPEVDKAIEEGRVDLAPRIIRSGEDNIEMEVPGKDVAVTDLLSGYGKFTPKPEVGGIQGFANKIGPYAPFLAAAAALAGPALAAELAAGELVAAPIASPALGITTIAPEAAGVISTVAPTAGGITALTPATTLPYGITSVAPATSSTMLPGAAALQAGGTGVVGGTAGTAGTLSTNKLLAASLASKALSGGSGGGGGAYTPSSTTTTTQAPPPSIASNTYNPAFTMPNMFAMNNAQMGNAYQPQTYRYYAQGGVADLGGYAAGGKLLKGPGDGMSDSIVANIAGKQPARLADGEFVVPADVVSHLGNGSTDAGAKHLYKMMDRIRQARTGNSKQGKRINPDKFLPKG